MHSTRALIKSVIASTESIAEMYLYAVRVVQTKKSEYCLGLFCLYILQSLYFTLKSYTYL